MTQPRTPRISIIVAAALNQAIGKDNQLLWHLPNDLRFFKRTTTGHPIVMGRKTYESVGKPLPNRRNIVISRQTDHHAEGIETVQSLDEAIELASRDTDEIFVVGGAAIYALALERTDRIYLTQVHASPEADTFFPEFDEAAWNLVSRETYPSDERHAYPYTFLVYDRITPTR